MNIGDILRICSFSNTFQTSTFGFVGFSPYFNAIVISFRGTVASKWVRTKKTGSSVVVSAIPPYFHIILNKFPWGTDDIVKKKTMIETYKNKVTITGTSYFCVYCTFWNGAVLINFLNRPIPRIMRMKLEHQNVLSLIQYQNKRSLKFLGFLFIWIFPKCNWQ